jgi:type I restriction enzyme, S subunit
VKFPVGDHQVRIRLRYLFSDRIGGSWGSDPEGDEGTICIRAADFQTHKLTHIRESLTRRIYERGELQRKQLTAGDLIIEKSGGGDSQPVGRIVRFDLTEPALCSNFLEILRPDSERLESRYGAYLLYSLWANRLVEPHIKQTTGIQNLDAESYFDMHVDVPSLRTQSEVADFLDAETTEIDALIAEKERMLRLLAEKRAALISHAVTRGLNPDVSMKPSGLGWLQDIPAHWRIVPVKHLGSIGNGSTPNRDRTEYWDNGDFPWLNSSVVNTRPVESPSRYVTSEALRECHLPFVKPPAVLVAITGQGKTRGRSTVLDFEATINQHLAYVKPRSNEANCMYLSLLLDSAYEYLRSDSDGAGSTRGAITTEQLGNFRVPLPGRAEQDQILQATRGGEVQASSQMEDSLHRSLALLRERRSALISAAVTGQLATGTA